MSRRRIEEIPLSETSLFYDGPITRSGIGPAGTFQGFHTDAMPS